MVIAMVLGVAGLLAGAGLFSTGLFKNGAVKMVTGITITALLLGVWFTAVNINSPAFLDTAINFITGFDWLVAPATGLAVGGAVASLF